VVLRRRVGDTPLSPNEERDRMEERWDVAVVGAGLAGLAAAATVARTGASVIVLDGRSPGGRARTDDLEGFRLNRGAHALFRRGAGRAVLDRLGVTVRGAAPPTKGAQGRHGERTGAVGLSSAGLVRSPLLTARG